MDKEVVKELNKLQSEKAALKVELFNAKNQEEVDNEEVEEINKQISGIESSILKLSPQLKGE